MKLRIPKDFFDNPCPPRLFLCTTGKKIINELPAYDVNLNASWNKYSELSFSIDRKYTDVITGEAMISPLFDKAEGLRKVYVENMGYFTIQDPDTTYSEKDSKSLSAFSSEYETSTKYLENFRINTGEVDSVEVMYLESVYGENYTIDTPYEPIGTSEFDKYEKYYIKKYTDNDSYTYEQVEIKDEDIYKDYDEPLYKEKFPNVRFYWPTKPELSLLHLIFKKIPEWKIKDENVDVTLWRKERKFDEDRVAVYDFLMNKVANTFKCVVEWDTINNEVSFYEEAEDGITEDNTIQTRFDTDIYITRENLANEINLRYSSDNIKTKLKVTGSDDLNIRDVNLGKNHIINLDFYHNHEWMEDDLYEAYSRYLEAVKEYSPLYSEAVSARARAYNRWNNLMNAVPIDDNVVQIGDRFKKLYCTYAPINTAYYKSDISNPSVDDEPLDNLYSDEACNDIINKTDLDNGDMFVVQGYQFKYQDDGFVYVRDVLGRENDEDGKPIKGTKRAEFVSKLSSYHINDDVNGNKTDNILLRLKDKDSNTITIRIYAPPVLATQFVLGETYYQKREINGKDFYSEFPTSNGNIEGLYVASEDYQICYETSNATSGIIKDDFSDTLIDWMKGNITAEALSDKLSLNLNNYTVSYIGTMGAYFVLAKDERIEANLEDYGVMLLREKHDVYTQIFQTQTENMYSQERYQCVVGDNPPSEPIPDNTRWLDSDTNPMKLYIYNADTYYDISSYIEGMTYYVDNNGTKSQAVPQPTAETFGDKKYYVKWTVSNGNVSTEDKRSHEDYQRYTDNYDKLLAVQKMLVKKEAEAEYCLNGYADPNIRVDIDYYKNNYNSSGESLKGVFYDVARNHFPEPIQEGDPNYEIYFVGNESDLDLSNEGVVPIYKFICSEYPNVYVRATTYKEGITYYIEDSGVKIQASTQPTAENFKDEEYYIIEHDYTFAVYLKGKVPYVAFASSVGVNQAKMDKYSQLTDFDEDAFSIDQWMRLSPFIREDEFNDSNFLLTGYESEEERMSICQELMESASKELKTLSQPSLEFSMNMSNILALPEFNSLTSQFALGNFIRIELRPGLVKRARLLNVGLGFSDLGNFSCQFGNLVTTQDQIDLHAELMQQAVQAGKQVATSASNWQKAVDKSNKLEEAIANGLADATLEIGRASGQSIVWDHSGIWGRKLKDGETDQYEDEQFRMVNNKLLFSNDGFKTSKSVMGKFVVKDDNGDDITRWGLLAEAMVGGYIEGSEIRGGNLRIGDGSNNYFQVSESGDVSIVQAGKEKYASVDAVKVIDDAYRYRIVLSYDKSTIFSNTEQDCTITCTVYSHSEDITNKVIDAGGSFAWQRVSSNGTKDDAWNAGHIQTKTNTDNPNKVTLKVSDIEGNSQFSCLVNFDELDS
jgi:hypothetical protein